MALTWAEPPVNGPFGPGVLINVTSDFIGPLQSGTRWTIDLTHHTTEAFMESSGNIFSQNKQLVTTYGLSSSGSWPINPVFAGKYRDASVDLTIKLIAPDLSVIDSGVRTVTYDPLVGIPYQLSTLNERLRSQVATHADMSLLQADVSNIKTASFADFGNGVLAPISSLLQSPPLGFLSREQITPDRTGEGTLTRVSGGQQVDAFGIAWEFVSVAAGIGVDEGTPDQLFTKALQFSLVHTLADSSLENTSHAEFDYGDGLWLFSPMLPTVLRYWIGPGITARFFWLIIAA